MGQIGRPNENLTRKISVKLTAEMYSKIEYMAKREGVSVSEYIRNAIKKICR